MGPHLALGAPNTYFPCYILFKYLSMRNKRNISPPSSSQQPLRIVLTILFFLESLAELFNKAPLVSLLMCFSFVASYKEFCLSRKAAFTGVSVRTAAALFFLVFPLPFLPVGLGRERTSSGVKDVLEDGCVSADVLLKGPGSGKRLFNSLVLQTHHG